MHNNRVVYINVIYVLVFMSNATSSLSSNRVSNGVTSLRVGSFRIEFVALKSGYLLVCSESCARSSSSSSSSSWSWSSSSSSTMSPSFVFSASPSSCLAVRCVPYRAVLWYCCVPARAASNQRPFVHQAKRRPSQRSCNQTNPQTKTGSVFVIYLCLSALLGVRGVRSVRSVHRVSGRVFSVCDLLERSLARLLGVVVCLVHNVVVQRGGRVRGGVCGVAAAPRGVPGRKPGRSQKTAGRGWRRRGR